MASARCFNCGANTAVAYGTLCSKCDNRILVHVLVDALKAYAGEDGARLTERERKDKAIAALARAEASLNG